MNQKYKKRFHPSLKAAAFALLVALSTTAVLGIARADESGALNRLSDSGWYTRNYTDTPEYNYFVHMAHSDLSGLVESAVLSNSPMIPHYQIYSVDYWLNRLNTGYESMVYRVEIGEKVYSNTNLTFEQIAANYERHHYENYVYERGEYGEWYWREYRIYFSSQDQAKPPRYIFALEDAYIQERDAEVSRLYDATTVFLYWAIALTVAFLICFAYALYSAGRTATAPNNKITPHFPDRFYTEVILGLTGLTLFLGFNLTSGYYYFNNDYHHGYHHRNFLAQPMQVLYIGAIAVGFTVGYGLILSIARHIKNGTFVKNSLLYKSYDKLLFLYSKGNPLLKIVIMVTGLSLLGAIPWLWVLTLVLALYIAYRYAMEFKALKAGVAAVRNGDYDAQIQLQGESEFALLARDIDQISSGLGDAVERRLKSERLKTDLIVNVSHDIRTPLTSLITYADLLNRELENPDTDTDNIKKYAEVISQKCDRLKHLTDDLFESAKASSGNISVNLESVDVNALIVQAIAELDEKIKQSSLEFKLNMPEQPVMTKADGRLLWRVIENLSTNALRYSLEHSRVYIDVRKVPGEVYGDSGSSGVPGMPGYVLIEMKNISKDELNIPADEMTERFKRGDLSRNTEGSGLGLDIASSLMKCQGGELQVSIDGDLFKVSVKVPLDD